MSQSSNKSIWWQRYLAVLVVLFVAALYIEFDSGELSDPLILLDLLLWLIAIVGVGGFVYDKQILHMAWWKVYLPVIIAWDLWVVVRHLPDGVGQPVAAFVSAGIVVVLLKVPEYFALYFYAFRLNKNN